MNQQVLTNLGLLNLDDLEIIDVVEIGDNYRKIASEFRYKGELVKRDVTVSALRPLTSESFEGNLNG